jgi:hypothetical protein
MTLDRYTTIAAELVELLLESPTVNYPWNPADPATADYYDELEGQFSLDDWSEAELNERANSFFTHINSCWADVEGVEASDSKDLTATLSQQFAHRVPQQWLSAIASKVSDLATSSLEPADKLVASVQDLLSNWAIDDLFVMARPYAYAMRCDTGTDNPDNVARAAVEWEQLSEMERAKLTILVAKYALDRATEIEK